MPTDEPPAPSTWPAPDSVEAGPSATDWDPNPEDEDALPRGSRLAQYRIKRKLGGGGMGQVYLAKDTDLGRLVALKVIRPGRIGAMGVRAFLKEARTTAKLRDPRIVTVYAVALEGDQPYLALEYLQGETLFQRLKGARPSPREGARILTAVARAIEHAHKNGVLHCDLKPANIMLTEDGRIVVVDFGLARHWTPEEHKQLGLRGGTPRYMAPEQWRGERLEPAVDTWAIGVMLYEITTGRLPFVAPSATLSDGTDMTLRESAFEDERISAQAEALIRQCLAPHPRQRPSISDVLARLSALAVASSSAGLDDEPFRGLLAFQTSESRSFFGRDAEIAACARKLLEDPVLPIVGASGSGKTSFVWAGLVPRLSESGFTIVRRMRPGPRPFHALAAALLRSADDGAANGERLSANRIDRAAHLLEEKEGELNLRLEKLAEDSKSKVLLVVDQLEELCTQGASPSCQAHFLAALGAAADATEERVRIILTLRDDFLGRLGGSPQFRKALESLVVLRPLERESLRDAMIEPLVQRGYSYENPAIVETMLDEIADEPARMPLAQFACRQLWAVRDPDRRLITRAAFESMGGGVAGALAEHAESTLEGMSPEEVRGARSLLLRLVSPQGTRRTLSRASVISAGSAQQSALRRLANARLVVERRNPREDDADALVEIVHESLVTTWPRLVRWRRDSGEEHAILEQIESAATIWDRRGRAIEETWQGEDLADIVAQLERLDVQLPEASQAFIQAGQARRARMRRRQRTALIIGAVVLILATLVSGWLAIVFAEREKQARNNAEELARATGDVGLFELVLRPFDLNPGDGAAITVDASRLPELKWTLHEVSPTDRHSYANEGNTQVIAKGAAKTINGELVQRIEARSGPSYLRITGRGRDGRTCGASVVPVRNLPKYSARNTDNPERIEISVPTCAASSAGMIPIPAGPFIRGGAGVPPIRNLTFVDEEEEHTLEAFSISRTETTNAAFAVFARMSAVTGIKMPNYPGSGKLTGASGPQYPVSAVDAFTAHKFCAFHGMRLPTTHEWEKAARGGLTLDGSGRQNPWPRRNNPWGPSTDYEALANLEGADDGYDGLAPVDAFPQGASPYGVLGTTGNVSEWTASNTNEATEGTQRIVRGGDWTTPPAQERHTLAYENARDPRFFFFGLGFRCAADT